MNGWTYQDALTAIRERSDYDRGYISNPFAGDETAALGLRRTAALLRRLGNPDQTLPIIHVAGSKGKGSTCAFLSAILHAAGYRTGRFTSPHLHSFRERFAIDEELISEADFASLAQHVLTATRDVEAAQPELGTITAFELTTAMAFDHFSRAGCDAAVIEVGLGGTLDATNIVDPVVSVITTLDFEHTAILGPTLALIAANKAGIIKPKRPVVVSRQPAEAMEVIVRAAASQDAPVLIEGRDWDWRGGWRHFSLSGPWGTFRDLQAGLPGDFQVGNAGNAVAALWAARIAVPVQQPAIRAGLVRASWPGRFEIVRDGSRTMVIDGAHTPASAEALASAWRSEFRDAPATIVLGVLADKDATAIVRALAPIARSFIATAPASPRALPVSDLASIIHGLGHGVESSSSVAAAVDLARTRAADAAILVTGSLFTVAEARESLGLAKRDPVPS